MSPNQLLPSSSRYHLIVIIWVFILTIDTPLAYAKDTYYPPNATVLRRAFFVNNLSFITTASVWVFFLIIFIIFRLYYLDERSKLHQVFDDCSPSTAQYKYLIRLRIGKSSHLFQKETSAIMIDLLDCRQCFITRLSISPSWLKADVYSRQSSDKPRLRSLKFVLNRANSMPTIGAIRLAHDSYFPVGGYIFLHSIEIRNLSENVLTQIPVFKRIFVLPPDANETDQVFNARRPSTNKEKASDNIDGFAPYLTFSEVIVFSFFYSNISLFTTMFMPNYIEISNIHAAVYNGLYGLVPSSLITVVLLFFYRFFVKIFYARSKAIGSWSIIRGIYLSAITLTGLVIGLASSCIQSRQTSHTLTYWSLAILIANASAAVVILPTVGIVLIVQIFISKDNPQSMLVPSFTSKAVDEINPGESKSLLTKSTHTKGSIVDEMSKVGKVDSNMEDRSKKVEEEYEDGKIEKMIVQKRSMEEGLFDKTQKEAKKTARERIIYRIQSVLGRSKEPNSQGEEKICDIDKRLEKRTHE